MRGIVNFVIRDFYLFQKVYANEKEIFIPYMFRAALLSWNLFHVSEKSGGISVSDARTIR